MGSIYFLQLKLSLRFSQIVVPMVLDSCLLRLAVFAALICQKKKLDQMISVNNDLSTSKGAERNHNDT